MKSNFIRGVFNKKNALLIVLTGLLIASVVFCAAAEASKFYYKNPLGEYGLPEEFSLNGETPPDITVDGKVYGYNPDVISILFMGYDKTEQRDAQGVGYQADALILAAVNRKTHELTLFNISRDTLADIAVFDINGNYALTQQAQIALSHAYGTDAGLSEDLTAAAVSRLLGGIPVTRYLAMDIDGIGPITEAMGGVVLELKAGFEMFNPNMRAGTLYNLKGDEAELYVRSRQIPGMSGENSDRMRLQAQFVSAFIKTLKTEFKENPGVLFDLAEAAAPHISTNLTAVEIGDLIKALRGASLSLDNITALPGETVRLKEILEPVFVTNGEELSKLILDTFYVEKGTAK